MKYTTHNVHIEQVRPGDTILHNGEPMTVCGTDIRKCSFMGITIFGDSYNLGTKPVIKIIYANR